MADTSHMRVYNPRKELWELYTHEKHGSENVGQFHSYPIGYLTRYLFWQNFVHDIYDRDQLNESTQMNTILRSPHTDSWRQLDKFAWLCHAHYHRDLTLCQNLLQPQG